MSLTNKVIQFDQDSDKVHAWVHGPATGAGSTITTDSGIVVTPAKLIADNEAEIQAIINVTDAWANGPATGTGSTVTMGGAAIHTPAKVIADQNAVINQGTSGVLALATAQANTATTQAGIATNQAGLATTNGDAQVTLATTQKDLAVVAKTAAELARDVALIQAGVYVDEPTGRAAVADGQAFKVQGTGTTAAYEYRRVNAGTVSTLIATYPSVLAYTTTKQASDDATLALVQTAAGTIQTQEIIARFHAFN